MIASTLAPDACLQPIFGLARLQPLGTSSSAVTAGSLAPGS